jgi:DNA-binding response OmpR family regulator
MTIKGRLFLLDDDELICSMLARSLKKEGYEVQSETSTERVIDKISAWCPDLVLLDIHLDEGKSGLEILEEMRREKIPGQVVMLTADDSAESAIAAMKLGAADYLTKPFNMAEVQLVIRNVIEKERLQEGGSRLSQKGQDRRSRRPDDRRVTRHDRPQGEGGEARGGARQHRPHYR